MSIGGLNGIRYQDVGHGYAPVGSGKVTRSNSDGTTSVVSFGYVPKGYGAIQEEHGMSGERSDPSHTLTAEELDLLAAQYNQDYMSHSAFDDLLVELVDMGAISEADRMAACGARQISADRFDGSAIYIQSDSSNFVSYEGDPRAWLSQYENFLWKQSLFLQSEQRDYSDLSAQRNSVRRVSEILSALAARK